MKPLRIIALILIFLILFLLLLHTLTSINQDIGRHLKSGEIILQNKAVYNNNLFSFTQPDGQFINHHWGGEVIFFLLNKIAGLKGLIILKAIIISLAFILIAASVYRKAKEWPILIAFSTGILVFIHRTDVRPEIFSYLILSFFLFAIYRAKLDGNYKYLFFIPLAQILWSNIHIYFALGPLLALLFLIDTKVHSPKYLSKVFKLFILTSLATLINPNFITGAIQPLLILSDYGYNIVENQSIFFLQNYGILFKQIYILQASLALLIFSFIIAIKNGARKITFQLLSSIIFGVLAIMMIRNYGIYALTITPVIALNLSFIKVPSLLKKKSIQATLLIIFISIALLGSIQVVRGSFWEWYSPSKKFGLDIPNGASTGVDFLETNNISGNVFNNFDVGSYLIWKRYPEHKVFVDGRPEAYSVEFFDNIYKPMQENPKIWKKLSEEFVINYIFFDRNDITPWARKFLSDISQNPNWPIVYLDNSVVIFIKNIPENQGIIEKQRSSAQDEVRNFSVRS